MEIHIKCKKNSFKFLTLDMKLGSRKRKTLFNFQLKNNVFEDIKCHAIHIRKV